MSYNRDLQEDKEPMFDTADTVRACVRLMEAMLKSATVNRAVCQAAAADPALLATDLADYLVRKGMPFRRAHHVVGERRRLRRGDWNLPLNRADPGTTPRRQPGIRQRGAASIRLDHRARPARHDRRSRRPAGGGPVGPLAQDIVLINRRQLSLWRNHPSNRCSGTPPDPSI